MGVRDPDAFDGILRAVRDSLRRLLRIDKRCIILVLVNETSCNKRIEMYGIGDRDSVELAELRKTLLEICEVDCELLARKRDLCDRCEVLRRLAVSRSAFARKCE